MIVIKYMISSFLKHQFEGHQDESLRDILYKKIIDDSKYLGLLLFVIYLFAIILIISMFILVFFSFSQNGIEVMDAVFYTAIFSTVLSVGSIFTGLFYLKKKIKIYQEISRIKSHTKKSLWFEPILIQLELERKKIKKEFL